MATPTTGQTPVPRSRAAQDALDREAKAALVPGSSADAETRRLASRGPAIKVEALENQYRDHVYRRPGDVFIIHGEKEFSARTMKRVDGRTPEKTTGAQEALDIENERRRRERAGNQPLSDEEVATGADNPIGDV
jgi:hypothetical protein